MLIVNHRRGVPNFNSQIMDHMRNQKMKITPIWYNIQFQIVIVPITWNGMTFGVPINSYYTT